MASERDNPASAAAKAGENVAAQFAKAANLYGGAFSGSFKATYQHRNLRSNGDEPVHSPLNPRNIKRAHSHSSI